MPTSIVALEILLILLPGFAAEYVVQLLALRAAQTDMDKVIEACLYSFLIYGSFVLFVHGSLPFDIVVPVPPSTETLIRWHPQRLIGLCAITFVASVLGALYINRDGNRLFRALKITQRTSRRSIWNDIFQCEVKAPQVVQVELADGRSLLGVLGYYSDAAEDCSLYLKQASWVGSDGGTVPIPGPGILLTKNSNIQSVSLLKH